MIMVIPITIAIAALFIGSSLVILLRQRMFLSSWARRIKRGPKRNIRTRFKWDVSLRSLGNLLSMLGRAVKPATGDEDLSRIKVSLIKAGYWGSSTPALFMGVKIVLMVLLPAALGVIRLNTRPFPPLLFVGAAAGGFYLPHLWLRRQIGKRKDRILKGLPDMLDLLIICTEAGLGLDSALSRVGQKLALSNKELSDELRIVMLEQRAGRGRQEALRNMAARVDMEEVNNLVGMLAQTDRFGTSVSQSLRVHAEFTRDRRQRKAEELANKLPMKLTFPLIFFIFPALFVILLGPVVVKVLRSLTPAFK